MIKHKLISQSSDDIYNTVLENRGLTQEGVDSLLCPQDFTSEINPTLFHNMLTAIRVLHEAIKGKKKIGLIPDPDVDGYSSSSMLHDFITRKLRYDNVEVIFHKKFPKSHGLDEDVVKQANKLKIDLLILPDAGSSLQDYERIVETSKQDGDKEKKTLLTKDMQILILDHHKTEYNADEERITMVNYNQPECEYPNKYLSGCAVTYKFIHAYAERHFEYSVQFDMFEYIDLVALSLVSDMMNLNCLENRLLLQIGSDKNVIKNLLLIKLIEIKKLDGDYLNFEDYAFTIGSQINGTIRVGTQKDKEMLFHAFFSDELVESKKRKVPEGTMVDIQTEIIRIMGNNKSTKQDKKIKKALEEIRQQIADDKTLLDNKVVAINIGDMVDSSITGVFANKLMYGIVNRPVLLYRETSEDENMIGGSGRGFKIESLQQLCKDTGLFKFVSGHDNAFGFSIEKKNLDKAIEILNEKLADVEFDSPIDVDRVYNGVVPIADVKAIGNIGDLFCNEIPEPMFLLKDVKMHTSKIERKGSSTYTFKIGDVCFYKYFGSLDWFSEVVLSNEIPTEEDPYITYVRLPFGGDIVTDILVKFKKSKNGFYYCDIVDMVSREDEEGVPTVDF